MNPSPFLRSGFSTPAVGSIFTNCAFAAQRNSPRMASRKCRACAGVCDRRSHPARTVATSILRKGLPPAVLSTCRKMFSRCLRVATDRTDHAAVSLYRAISHSSVPVAGAPLTRRGVPDTAIRYSALKSGDPNSARSLMRGPLPTRTYQTALPCLVVSRCRCGGRGRGMVSIRGRSPRALQGRSSRLWMAQFE